METYVLSFTCVLKSVMCLLVIATHIDVGNRMWINYVYVNWLGDRSSA